MNELLANNEAYLEMRRKYRLNSISNNTWFHLFNKMLEVINDKI